MEKNLFRLFDVVVVNSHMLHNKQKQKSLENFSEKFPEGLLASPDTEM